MNIGLLFSKGFRQGEAFSGCDPVAGTALLDQIEDSIDLSSGRQFTYTVNNHIGLIVSWNAVLCIPVHSTASENLMNLQEPWETLSQYCSMYPR